MLRRLSSLRKKHAILEARIVREHSRLLPDTLRLQTLKKLRLRHKEEITRLEENMMRKTSVAQG